MNKKFIWLSVIVFVFTLSQPSFAFSGDHKQGHAQHKIDKLAKELDLTADQKAKIKAYKEQARASFKANYAQLKSLRSQINSLVQSDKIDEAKLDTLVDQVNKIRGSMLKNRIMMQHQMFALLNDKQKAKFIQLKKKWHKEHHAE